MKVNFSRIVIHPDKDSILNMLTNLLQCKICMNIINDPYDCVCCNQTFCKTCITHYIQMNKKCPYSNFFGKENEGSVDTIKPSSSNLKKLVSSLKFNCAYQCNGCNCELSIEDLSEHEINCKYKNGRKMLNESNLNQRKNSKEKDKFRFQDSSMTFKKVDVNQLDTHSGSSSHRGYSSSKNVHSNQKLNEKIDSLYEMISTMYNTTVRKDSKIKTKPDMIKKKTFSNIITDKQTKSTNKSIDESTPKFKEHKDKFNQNCNDIKILNEINNINNRLLTIEHLIQSTSQSAQRYSIEKEVEVPLSTKSTNYKISYPSSINSSFNGQSKITSTPKSTKTKMNIKKKFPQQVLKNSFCFTNKPSTPNRVINDNSMNTVFSTYQNMNLTIPSLSPSSQKEETKEYIDHLFNEKIESIKQYIDGQVTNDLKKYFLELFLDNTNLLVSKINEPKIKEDVNSQQENENNCSFNNTVDNCTN